MDAPSERNAGAQVDGAAVSAEAPRPPVLPIAHGDLAERATYLAEREDREHRSVSRGLLWLALLALVISLIRAGFGRSFYAGWWRQWW